MVKEVAKFVNDLLKRPIITEYDQQAEDRFIASLERNLNRFAKDGQINENSFCELMRTFETTSESEYTDEEQYDMFLERLFYRIRHEKCEEVAVEEFKDLIERSGFRFSPGEFNNLLKWYFRGKEKITLEEFKLFATGNCVKVVDAKKK